MACAVSGDRKRLELQFMPFGLDNYGKLGVLTCMQVSHMDWTDQPWKASYHGFTKEITTPLGA
jgi:hypothetical protein